MSTTPFSRRFDCAAVAVVTALAVAAAGCFQVRSLQYKPTPLTDVHAGQQTYRFDLVSGDRVEMRVDHIRLPFVQGRTYDDQPVTLDLRKVEKAAVLREDRDEGGTAISYFAGATGVYAAVLLTVVIIVLATKSSCPFLYVDDGGGHMALVGEAYSGAAFRSIARDDLLPVPLPAGDTLRARLANEAHETQYTDRLELVTVDHPPDVRVLSSFDARVIAAGARRPPLSARDTDGRDVAALVRDADERAWQTDLGEMSARQAPPLRESLDLVFAPSTTSSILELVLSNTYWIDSVMGRFFAMMGTRLPSYLDKGNAADAGDKVRGWREREGLDLRVEAEIGGRWQPVAVIPTVGPMALRRVAVPLPPAVAAGAPQKPVHVRVSGGLGFWRFDEASLSDGAPLPGDVRHIAPSRAADAAGGDHRDLLRVTDGRSQVLADVGDRMELQFPLPPLPRGRRRTGFVLTHGYYNVHAPPAGDWSPLALRDIRDRPGALASYGVELFRSYMRLAAAPAPAGVKP